MKLNLKNISLILVAILAIGILVACSPQEPPKDNELITEDLTLATGYAQSKSTEDGKSFIEFSVEGEDLKGEYLKLEAIDEGLFNSIEENEFFIFAYNEDRILRNVQRDFFLKDLLENNMDEEPGEDDDSLQEILAEDSIPMDGLTLLDEYNIDFNDDGYEEIIAMYTAAGRDSSGEIMWDDGQRWVLLVHGDDKDYVLYDDYVQLGSIEFSVFTEDGDFYITTTSRRTANFTVTQYIYKVTSDSFIQTIPYDVKGNVNMLHSSN